jgi:thiol-disulfide isomerase/thioredoxin
MFDLRKIMTLGFALASLFWLNVSFAKTYVLSNCRQLESANALLLVHASWFPHCKTLLPIYKKVSNLPQMQSYKFYVKQHDKGGPVCGNKITALPVVFTHNMSNHVSGEMSMSSLIQFVTD